MDGYVHSGIDFRTESLFPLFSFNDDRQFDWVMVSAKGHGPGNTGHLLGLGQGFGDFLWIRASRFFQGLKKKLGQIIGKGRKNIGALLVFLLIGRDERLVNGRRIFCRIGTGKAAAVEVFRLSNFRKTRGIPAVAAHQDIKP